MNHRNHRRPQTTAADPARRRSPHSGLPSRRGVSFELISDAVVASYIHDISARHGRGVSHPGGRLREAREATQAWREK
jgi:hypothetical protein